MHRLCVHDAGRLVGLHSFDRQQRCDVDVQGFSASADDVPVLLLIDTAGCDMEEQAEEDGDSKRNEGEAKVNTPCLS